MTDRDHFAAAALTGLIASREWPIDSDEAAHYCYRVADAMLRERGDHIADAGKMAEASQKTQDWLASTPQVPRKPRTPQSDRLAEWERHGSRHWGLGVASDLYDVECRVAVLEQGSAATPATDQERFNAAVMNWISEASTVLFHRMEQTTGGREIISDACERCWIAYGKHSTNHDAAPAAIATVGRPRTDKADLPTRCGTGDTPVAESATTAEPVAWGVADLRDGLLCTSTRRSDASEMQAEFALETKIVPLYRQPQPTLTDEEREALHWVVGDVADITGPIEDTLRGLLERHKGGKR